MHVVLIISSLSAGGAERVLSGLANHWAKRGHTVTILTLAPSDAIPFYPLDKKIKLEQLGLSEISRSLPHRLLNILKRILTLRKTIKTLSPDVVVSFISSMNITTLLATWGLTIPVVVSERTHPLYHKLPPLDNLLRRLLYPKAAKIVVQTQSAADYFLPLDNIAVIPNSVRIPPILAQQQEDVHHIISVGRLIPSKGFDSLIQAFGKIAHDFPKIHLTLYGEGEERRNLEKLVSELNLKDRIDLPGLVQDVQAKLAKADLFIFPSHYEGFPNALCEAMAAGLPIIASNCSGNIDVIQDGVNGRLFPVADIGKLTHLMRELIQDPAQRHRLSIEAQKITEHLAEDKIYQMWDDLICPLTAFAK
ncbi:MAG: glycosyltransferase family 4 protein [Candidatus Paracaedibacteraceae bacterium]|nr:glycosyltransferase family 4 protein [Candidatus Paracaedibacteraceae bacterium]